MKQIPEETIERLRRLLFGACFLPLAALLADSALGELGPDPVARILETTGTWTLNLVLATLGFTPLRKLTGWNWLMRWRRTIALYAFFYGCLHGLAYLLFEQSFDGLEIAKDILWRPYVAAGWVAFIAMVPLAITSTNAMMKKMGGKNWKALHRLTYLVGVAGALHYFWLVKRDVTLPGVYWLILALLLAVRLTGRRPGRKGDIGTIQRLGQKPSAPTRIPPPRGKMPYPRWVIKH